VVGSGELGDGLARTGLPSARTAFGGIRHSALADLGDEGVERPP
jgi:hypothetical protein